MQYFWFSTILSVTGGIIIPIILILSLVKRHLFGVDKSVKSGYRSYYDFVAVMVLLSFIMLGLSSLMLMM